MTWEAPPWMCCGRLGGGVLETAPKILALDSRASLVGPGTFHVVGRLSCQDSHSTSGRLPESQPESQLERAPVEL